MLELSKVFSSGAMFLHDAPLDVIGKADINATVSVKIARDGVTVSEGSACSDGQGAFKVRVITPKGSLDEYTVTVTAGDDLHVMENVLFGELWLACGQSNMEMPNGQQPGGDRMIDSLKGKKIRAFTGVRLGHNAEYPISPVFDTDGWCLM